MFKKNLMSALIKLLLQGIFHVICIHEHCIKVRLGQSILSHSYVSIHQSVAAMQICIPELKEALRLGCQRILSHSYANFHQTIAAMKTFSVMMLEHCIKVRLGQSIISHSYVNFHQTFAAMNSSCEMLTSATACTEVS